MDEYAASLVKTINVCLSHVEIAERVVAAKGYDWQRQARIRKAQYKPIDMNIKRLETMGRGHLIPQEARDFMATR
jgi:hypothetical protein